jgi:hypothetical protein
VTITSKPNATDYQKGTFTVTTTDFQTSNFSTLLCSFSTKMPELSVDKSQDLVAGDLRREKFSISKTQIF